MTDTESFAQLQTPTLFPEPDFDKLVKLAQERDARLDIGLVKRAYSNDKLHPYVKFIFVVLLKKWIEDPSFIISVSRTQFINTEQDRFEFYPEGLEEALMVYTDFLKIGRQIITEREEKLDQHTMEMMIWESLRTFVKKVPFIYSNDEIDLGISLRREIQTELGIYEKELREKISHILGKCFSLSDDKTYLQRNIIQRTQTDKRSLTSESVKELLEGKWMPTCLIENVTEDFKYMRIKKIFSAKFSFGEDEYVKFEYKIVCKLILQVIKEKFGIDFQAQIEA